MAPDSNTYGGSFRTTRKLRELCLLLVALACASSQLGAVLGAATGSIQIQYAASDGTIQCLQYAPTELGGLYTATCGTDSSFNFTYSATSDNISPQGAAGNCVCPSEVLGTVTVTLAVCSADCTWSVGGDGIIKITSAAYAKSTDVCLAPLLDSSTYPQLKACGSAPSNYFKAVTAGASGTSSPAASPSPVSPPPVSGNTTISPTTATDSSVNGSSPTVSTASPSTTTNGTISDVSGGSSSSGSSLPAIIGAVIGGIVVLAAGIGIGVYCVKRRRVPLPPIAAEKSYGTYGSSYGGSYGAGGPSSGFHAKDVSKIPHGWGAQHTAVNVNDGDAAGAVAKMQQQQGGLWWTGGSAQLPSAFDSAAAAQAAAGAVQDSGYGHPVKLPASGGGMAAAGSDLTPWRDVNEHTDNKQAAFKDQQPSLVPLTPKGTGTARLATTPSDSGSGLWDSGPHVPREMDSALLLKSDTFHKARSPEEDDAADALLSGPLGMCREGTLFAGRYTLTGDYARGSRSIVCYARHVHSKAKVVIKMFADERCYGRELAAYQALSNRYVARLEDSVPAGDGWPAALVLERGDYTLADWLKRTRPDALVQKVVLSQVLQALSSLHQQNMVHNDLKPANIMWFADSHSWKLIDLDNWTRSGTSLSPPYTYTLGYAAPELIRSEVDGAASVVLHTSADMWAFGLIAYEVLTGVPFFGAGTPDDTVYTMLAGRWPLPTEQREGGALEGVDEQQARRLLAHLLSRNPTSRWSATHAISNAWFRSAADTVQKAETWGGLRQQIAAVQRMSEVTVASLASANALICVTMEQFEAVKGQQGQQASLFGRSNGRIEVMMAEEDNVADPIFMLLLGHQYQINISVCHEKGQLCPVADILGMEVHVAGGRPLMLEVNQLGVSWPHAPACYCMSMLLGEWAMQ